MCKVAGPNALETSLDVLQRFWQEETIPSDFLDSLVVFLYKNKGSESHSGNYTGISFLSIAGKIFVRLIFNQHITVSEQSLPEVQHGFRSDRSTVDIIFAIRQFQDTYIKQNMPIHSVIIDLTKSFDTVNREKFWES